MPGVRLPSSTLALLPMNAARSMKDIQATGLPLPIYAVTGTTRRREPRLNRNAPCRCDGKLKYKHCTCYKARRWG